MAKSMVWFISRESLKRLMAKVESVLDTAHDWCTIWADGKAACSHFTNLHNNTIKYNMKNILNKTNPTQHGEEIGVQNAKYRICESVLSWLGYLTCTAMNTSYESHYRLAYSSLGNLFPPSSTLRIWRHALFLYLLAFWTGPAREGGWCWWTTHCRGTRHPSDWKTEGLQWRLQKLTLSRGSWAAGSSRLASWVTDDCDCDKDTAATSPSRGRAKKNAMTWMWLYTAWKWMEDSSS